jgi:2-phospho-L-lactate guanylyltransferase (CobY/MobA/RfbA family)
VGEVVKRHFYVKSADRVREVFRLAYLFAVELADGNAVEVIVRTVKSKRTLEQNAKMWAMLTDIAEQKQWIVDGRLQYLEPEEWKDILTAALTQELRVAQGVNGGMVLLGRRTSKMTISQMQDLIEVMQAFAAEHGVRWTVNPKSVPEQWRAAA